LVHGRALGTPEEDKEDTAIEAGESVMDIVVVILLILILGLLVFYLPRLLTKRAARQVVKLFRKAGATDAKHAVTLDSLGLVPAGMFSRMFQLRDYRPVATNLLIRANIIRQTRNGKYYLVEKELERTTLDS